MRKFIFNGILLLSFFVLFASSVFGQGIKGVVKSSISNEKLQGVTVRLLDTEIGTLTDENGFFEITGAEKGDTLMFSSIGFKDRSILVEDGREIEVLLYPVTSDLEQIVVVGYGSVKKKDLTGSITEVSGDDYK